MAVCTVVDLIINYILNLFDFTEKWILHSLDKIGRNPALRDNVSLAFLSLPDGQDPVICGKRVMVTEENKMLALPLRFS